MKEESLHFEIIWWNIITSPLDQELLIVMQSDDRLFYFKKKLDSVMSQILDDNKARGTTKDILLSIIKKSRHFFVEISDFSQLRMIIPDITSYNLLKLKLREIKINQIIK